MHPPKKIFNSQTMPLKKTKAPIDFESALSRCAALCSKAEHSEFEVRRKLRQWGTGMNITERVIEQLNHLGFLDEERFAKAFVNDKYKFDGWGRVKIRYMLKQHGISESSIDMAMSVIDEREYRKLMVSLLESKNRTIPHADPNKRKTALIRFAASRGFKMAEAIETIDRLSEGADDFELSDN